jgi:hypothetical protein
MALPGTVTIYPLPQTVVPPTPGSYSYSIMNNQPVVAETTTRKIGPHMVVDGARKSRP